MRAPLLCLLLALPALGGCLDPAAPPAGDATARAMDPDPLVAAAFAPSVLLGQPEGYGFGGEPSVAVAPDGTVYVAAPMIPATRVVTGGVQSHVWRSTDGGASFTLLNGEDGRLTDEGSGGGDADVAVDSEGRVHVVDLGGGGIPYRHSADGGDTWTYRDTLNGDVRPVDRQWIDAHGPDLVAAAWAWNEGNPRTLMFRRSLDGGETWEEPVPLTERLSRPGPVELAPDGATVYVPFTGGDYRVHAAVSHDAGETWTITDVDRQLFLPSNAGNLLGYSPTAVFPVIADDGAGTTLFAWSEFREDGGTTVYASRSFDRGLRWTEPEALTPLTGNALFPWVVAGDAGRFAVTFLRSETGGDPNTGAHEWYVHAVTTTTGDQGEAAWVDALVQDAPAHVGAVCTHGGNCPALGLGSGYGDRRLLDFFEAALTPDGDLVVTWTQTDAADGRNPQVRFARQTGGTRLLADAPTPAGG